MHFQLRFTDFRFLSRSYRVSLVSILFGLPYCLGILICNFGKRSFTVHGRASLTTPSTAAPQLTLHRLLIVLSHLQTQPITCTLHLQSFIFQPSLYVFVYLTTYQSLYEYKTGKLNIKLPNKKCQKNINLRELRDFELPQLDKPVLPLPPSLRRSFEFLFLEVEDCLFFILFKIKL